VLSQCPTQAGRYMEGTSDPGELLDLFKKRAIPVDRAKGLPAADLEKRIIVGRLYHSSEKKEFSSLLYESFPRERKVNDDSHR